MFLTRNDCKIRVYVSFRRLYMEKALVWRLHCCFKDAWNLNREISDISNERRAVSVSTRNSRHNMASEQGPQTTAQMQIRSINSSHRKLSAEGLLRCINAVTADSLEPCQWCSLITVNHCWSCHYQIYMICLQPFKLGGEGTFTNAYFIVCRCIIVETVAQLEIFSGTWINRTDTKLWGVGIEYLRKHQLLKIWNAAF